MSDVGKQRLTITLVVNGQSYECEVEPQEIYHEALEHTLPPGLLVGHRIRISTPEGEEVFPVMFGVAAPSVAYRVISRLNNPDFQTEAGLRTVSRLSPDYTPYGYVGLSGGVWPGLSFWYAFAASKIYPDAMAHNLECGYAQYLRDPRIYNTVPGQFSEWFDGESLVNRGMRLSPWEPPRYLWAAVEGACGLNVSEGPDRYSVDPLMPSGWRWLAVRQIPLRGGKLSYFIARDDEGLRVFATSEIKVEGAAD